MKLVRYALQDPFSLASRRVMVGAGVSWERQSELWLEDTVWAPAQRWRNLNRLEVSCLEERDQCAVSQENPLRGEKEWPGRMDGSRDSHSGSTGPSKNQKETILKQISNDLMKTIPAQGSGLRILVFTNLFVGISLLWLVRYFLFFTTQEHSKTL